MKALITEQHLKDIADAIREKSGSEALLRPAQMAAAILAINGVDDTIAEFNQVNSAAAGFLAAEDYDPTDYTGTQITDYTDLSNPSLSQGAGKTLALSGAGTVYLTDESSGAGWSDAFNGAYTVYNLIPGHVYRWLAKKADGATVGCGRLRATGNLRMLRLPVVLNVRDLGGWACDGGRVRYGIIFRGREFTGGNYPAAGAGDYKIARDVMRISSEFDLRTDSETDGPDQIVGTDDDITASVFGATVRYMRFVVGGYANLLVQTKAAGALFNRLLGDVADGHVAYIHCMAGADRTGTVCAILLAVLGVGQSNLDKEFELTSFAGEWRKRTDTGWIALMNGLAAMSATGLRNKAIQWLESVGVSIARINAFRAAVIDGTPETVSSQVPTASVSITLSHASGDNQAETAAYYQPFLASFTPDEGYGISAVCVTMGGEDITDSAWSGTPHPWNGGYYARGTVLIPRVTGNVVITVTAFEVSETTVNLIDSVGIAANTRLSTSDGSNKSMPDFAAIGAQKNSAGMIHLAAGDVLRIRGITLPAAADNTSAVCVYSADAGFGSATYISQATTSFGNMLWSVSGNVITITAQAERWLRLCGPCDDPTSVLATINQELPAEEEP
jgi:Protein tyrosine/serine phosphatase